mmetsp:Transcript_11973/g.11849  ORF Transcript_11973/g.11849 Transcript_11973/m.11849 type:complete len:87 (+) Transcript_11973:391-651(+)
MGISGSVARALFGGKVDLFLFLLFLVDFSLILLPRSRISFIVGFILWVLLGLLLTLFIAFVLLLFISFSFLICLTFLFLDWLFLIL